MFSLIGKKSATLPLAVALISLVAVGPGRTNAGTLVQGFTNAANNDDFTGPFGGDFNSRGFLNLAGFNSDQLFVVQPSGGTTEYLIRLSAIFGAPITAVNVQLGFGVGDNFVSAANVLPALDFDAPLASTPAPRSDVFTNVRHRPHVIDFSGGTGTGFVVAAAQFAIDIPDLPVSVNSFYAADELPANVPEGAAVFTIRQRVGPFIPEPCSFLLLCCGAMVLVAVNPRARNSRSAVANIRPKLLLCLVTLFGVSTTAQAATVTGATTGSPNNDNYSGTFTANPNRHSPGGQRIAAIELVIPVTDSGGTSEYSFTISGGYSTADGPITRDYLLQLGFGTGNGFVPASQIAPGLDFDVPLPATPAPQIAIFAGVEEHNADALRIPGLPVPLGQFSSFFLNDMFRVSIDVPDLPDAVRNFYSAANLPTGVPAGTKAFTIRGGFVPEPTAATLAAAALAALAWRRAPHSTASYLPKS
jgi:hypothetical protein